MAALFDSNHVTAQETALSIDSVAASSVITQVFSVGGVDADHIYDLAFPVTFSGATGLYVTEAKGLSAGNLRVAFFNTTNAAIVPGEVTCRLTSR